MTAGIVRIVRKFPSYPSTSGRAPLSKKARAAGVKSITINETGWKFQTDIRTFRTAIVSCLKGRMGRSRIDRGNLNYKIWFEWDIIMTKVATCIGSRLKTQKRIRHLEENQDLFRINDHTFQ
ncbi:hypothetical protein AVEN_153049-1 [Araneus ventricosus]|uniref:Uncharacterized protein n=1 Tax=Araneus ventricosus TaxID=182803 RepID=A0A4Y2MXP9_ARAVE|nr:hypothetical protein AVEN_153049-1 [Araneus ventricosus]